MDTILGKIGPHEGVEFNLFKNNKKDIIYFCFDYQPDNHEKIAKELEAECLTFQDKEFKLPHYIYYRKGMLTQAEELREILLSGLHKNDDDWEENEYRIGELLGYSREDVELFIKRFKKHHNENT